MPDTRLEWVESATGTPKLVERQPEQNQGPPPPVDVIAKQRDKQAMKMLQEQLGKVEAEEGQKMGDELSAINNQFMLKQRAMRAKFDAERDPARKQSIQQQMMDIKTQFQGKMQGVKDKYAPTKRQVEQARASGMQQIQQAAQKRDFELQVLRKNVNNFKSDAFLRQAEYKAIGIDVPLSQLEVKPDPEQTKQRIVRDIRVLDTVLERYTPGKVVNNWFDKKPLYVDPMTGEERKLDSKNPEDAAIINSMRGLEAKNKELRAQLQELYLQDPNTRAAVENSQRRKDAKNMYLPSNNTEKGGSIEASITNTISKQNKGRVRVQSPNGQTGTVTEKELASYIAQGFKRI